jgi:hypothetical protein
MLKWRGGRCRDNIIWEICSPFLRSKVCYNNQKITEKYSLVREVTSKWEADKLSNVVYGSHYC